MGCVLIIGPVTRILFEKKWRRVVRVGVGRLGASHRHALGKDGAVVGLPAIAHKAKTRRLACWRSGAVAAGGVAAGAAIANALVASVCRAERAAQGRGLH